MQKCAFFDRDGVVNEDYEYVHRAEDFVFCKGIFELLLWLKNQGYLLLLVTNQSGIARGFYTAEEMHALHSFMQQQLRERLGFGFDSIYFCPHAPEAHCTCRKPNTGMIESAKAEHSIDLAHSLFIGDRLTDMECATRAGIGLRFLVGGRGELTDSQNIQKVATLQEVLSIMQGFNPHQRNAQ